jgi:hypothetical protein
MVHKNEELPHQDTPWQLWNQDQFDSDCPRQLEGAGHGLVAGLKILWLHHLREAILPDGSVGFARFNLWLPQEKRSITIQSAGPGIKRLRHWVLQPDPVFDPSASGQPNQRLLSSIAQAHCLLIAKGLDEDILCQIAAQSKNMEAFIKTIAEI